MTFHRGKKVNSSPKNKTPVTDQYSKYEALKLKEILKRTLNNQNRIDRLKSILFM